MNVDDYRELLIKAFGNVEDSPHREDYSKRLLELKNIFYAQFRALYRIRKQCFFDTISRSFEEAIVNFLNMISGLRKLETKLYKSRISSIELVKSVTKDEEYFTQHHPDENAEDDESVDDILLAMQALNRCVNWKDVDSIREAEVTRDCKERALYSLESVIVNDSYCFIKSFDNALQGYFNTDRQFLEFPGHHVSLYDLPVKLGTVYISFIEKVINSFGGNGSPSFLLCPEPFEENGPNVIRLLKNDYELYSKYTVNKDGKPTEMCLISVPFSSLFDPERLCIILAHEIAHYIDREDFRLVGERNAILFQACCLEFNRSVMLSLPDFLETIRDFSEMHDSEQNAIVDKIVTSFGVAYEAALKNNIEEETTRIERISDTTAQSVIFTLTSFRWLVEQAAAETLKQQDSYQNVMLDNLRISEDILHTIKNKLDDKIASLFDERLGQLFYVIKEAGADILAIMLLGVKEEAYSRCIDYEIKKSQGSQNPNNQALAKYQAIRKKAVCSTMNWESDDVTADLSDGTYNNLVDYLENIKKNMNKSWFGNNEAAEMMKEIVQQEVPYVLSDYML